MSSPIQQLPERGLIEDAHGLLFEHIGASEAEFLYEEIFVRRGYLQAGVTLPRTGRPTVVDVGANIGLFSLFCHRENPRCSLVAVEPAPAAFAALERNLSDTRAVCVCRALADSAGVRGSLTVYPDAPGESSRHPRERAMQQARLRSALSSAGSDSPLGSAAAGQGVEHACVVGTLSDLLAELSLGRVDLLKVDCEGDELRVLHGLRAHDWRRVRQIVLEVHDLHGRLRAVLALLRRHGFSVTVQQQRSGTVGGYHMVVPDALRLFLVFAVANGSRRTLQRRPRAGATDARRAKRT